MMKRLMMIAALLALNTIFATTAIANGSYTFANGFYWNGSQAYTRAWTRFYDPKCGYYYGYQYLRAAYADPAKSLSYKDSDWREKLVDLLKQRDAYVLAAKNAEAEQSYFERSFEMLGLGSFGVQGYGAYNALGPVKGYAAGQAAGYDNPYYQQAGEGGSLYGVSSATATINATTVDLNEPLNYAGRLLENSARYQSQGFDRYIGAVNQLGETVMGSQAVSAEIEARARAAAMILEKLAVSSRTLTLKSGESVVGGQAVGGEASAQVVQYVALRNACASCHTGPEAKKGLVLDGSTPISTEHFQLAFAKVIDGTMPPPDAPVKLEDDSRGDVLIDLHLLTNWKSQ